MKWTKQENICCKVIRLFREQWSYSNNVLLLCLLQLVKNLWQFLIRLHLSYDPFFFCLTLSAGQHGAILNCESEETKSISSKPKEHKIQQFETSWFYNTNLLMRRCCRRILMKSKVLKPSSNTSWFSHSLSSLAVCGIQRDEVWDGWKNTDSSSRSNTLWPDKETNVPWGFLRLHQLSFVRQWHHHRNGWADAGARRHRCPEDVDPFSSPSSHPLWHQAKWRVNNLSLMRDTVQWFAKIQSKYRLSSNKYWGKCCTYIGWKSTAHTGFLSFAVFIWVFISYLTKLVFIPFLHITQRIFFNTANLAQMFKR